MATIDLLFDASAHLYPEYHGGLRQLTEEVTLSNFIFSFESLNNNIRLTSEQLRDCWFYVLNQEYQKIMSNKAHLTEEQIEFTEKLLSRGIQQGNKFSCHGADWDAAEYSPDLKAPQKVPKLQCRSHKDRLSGKPQNYDPLMLLQSMPEIRAQAERFYQDGLAKFLSQGLRAEDPVAVKGYKSSCVAQAEEYVKCLLIDKYRKDEHAVEEQISRYEESKLKDPSHQYKWKRDPKLKPVWTQIKAARKQIISGVGTSPLVQQDAVMDTDSITKNLNRGISSNQMAVSRTSGVSGFFRTVDAAEYRSVLRKLRNEKMPQHVRAAEVAKDSKRSEQLTKKQLRLAQGKQRFTGLETNLENLSFAPAKEVLNLVKQKRRKRKVASRIEDEIEKNLLADMDGIFSMEKSPPSFNNSAHSTPITEDSGSISFPIKQQHMNSSMAPIFSSNFTAVQNLSSPSAASGPILRSSRLPLGAEIKTESLNFPTNPQARETFTAAPTSMGASEVRPMTAKTTATGVTTVRSQTQGVPNLKVEQVDRGPSEMDIEISGRIAELKIKR